MKRTYGVRYSIDGKEVKRRDMIKMLGETCYAITEKVTDLIGINVADYETATKKLNSAVASVRSGRYSEVHFCCGNGLLVKVKRVYD